MSKTTSITIKGNKSHILKYPISCLGKKGDIVKASKFILSSKNCHFVACANPHSLVVASRDQVFHNALKETDLLLPDGVGILLASKILSYPISERVTGFDFFVGLSDYLAQSGGARYFFLGSSDYVLDSIIKRINQQYKEITVCGKFSPPFKSEFSSAENTDMISMINNARPDVLWVGMTAPKQEKWIYANRSRLELPLACAIGAVFDFYAGTKERSSLFWQKTGLEWLPRFLREPGRLWERNLRSAPIFLYWIAKEKVKQNKVL